MSFRGMYPMDYLLKVKERSIGSGRITEACNLVVLSSVVLKLVVMGYKLLLECPRKHKKSSNQRVQSCYVISFIFS
ncbi:hypothetical protein YC2023_106929 [Brassica napus]